MQWEPRLSYSDFRMADIALRRRDGTALKIFLALLCVVLVMLAGTAQVLHMHADGTDTHANCSLCAAAHVGVQVTSAPVPSATLEVSARQEVRDTPRPANRVSAFALFTRPPPAA